MSLLASHLANKICRPRFCQFHTTASCQALPLIVKYAVKIFGKGAAIFIGRKLRFKQHQRHSAEKIPFTEMIRRYKKSIIAGCSLFGLGSIFYYTHLENTPITQRRRFIMFSPHQYEYFYGLLHEETEKAYKDHLLPSSSGWHMKVSQILNHLLKANSGVAPSISEMQWKVHILDHAASSDYAFSLPTGDIYVNKALIEVCESDDELAGVIGHEMAHVTLHHHNELVSHEILKDSFLVLLIVAIWTYLTSDFSATLVHVIVSKLSQIIINLPYSRQQEAEADEVSLQFCAKACYDVRYLSAFYHKLKLLNLPQKPALLSTHPSLDTRITILDELIPKALKQRLSCGCSILPDADPRAKFLLDSSSSRHL